MIVRYKPEEGLDQADQAWFESDAPTNAEAIREIDAEASRHGLVRTREYWLQTFSLPDGRIVRRGFCYRPALSQQSEQIAGKRGTSLEGSPSNELVRAIRESE